MTLLAGLRLTTALTAEWAVDAETDQGALAGTVAGVTAERDGAAVEERAEEMPAAALLTRTR
jgi:hypothetical protein